MLTRFDYTRIIMHILSEVDPVRITRSWGERAYLSEAGRLSAELVDQGALTSNLVKACFLEHLDENLSDEVTEQIVDRINRHVPPLAVSS